MLGRMMREGGTTLNSSSGTTIHSGLLRAKSTKHLQENFQRRDLNLSKSSKHLQKTIQKHYFLDPLVFFRLSYFFLAPLFQRGQKKGANKKCVMPYFFAPLGDGSPQMHNLEPQRKSLGFVPSPFRIDTSVVYVGPGPGP